MLAKCSTPSCSAAFRHLQEARLFRLERDPVIRTGKTARMEHFWLCQPKLPPSLVGVSGEIDDILNKGNVVGLFGTAQGTYSVNGKLIPENHWEIPAAWKAVVQGGRVSEWRVYADNEPVWKIMGVKRY